MYGSGVYGGYAYGGSSITSEPAVEGSILPDGIASTIAFGVPMLMSGPGLILPDGIASSAIFGVPVLTADIPITAPIGLDSRTFTEMSPRTRITHLVTGDAARIQRTYTGLLAPIIITKAWLTIKRLATAPDSAAIIGPIVITTAQTSAGQITDAATDTLAMYFDLTAADTELMRPHIPYSYDIQVLTANGDPYTCEIGRFSMLQGVTVVAA